MNILHHTSTAIEQIDQSSATSLYDAIAAVAKDLRTEYAGSSSGASEKSSDNSLVAVITVEEDTRYFTQTLTAVMKQTVTPGVIIIAQCVQNISKISAQTLRQLDTVTRTLPVPTHVVPVQANSFGQAVTNAVNTALDNGIIAADAQYLWLLHDDSKPGQENYVELLNEVRRNNAKVSIIGAKQLSWDGEALANVGYFAHPRHNVTSLGVDGEPDQEQYNSRQDVFAVSLAGAFVHIAEWMRLGGFSFEAGTFGQSRDYGRRMVRSGRRVIVEPKAQIFHRRARFEGVRTMQGEVHKYDVNDSRTKRNSSFAVFAARDAYYYSDVSRLRWLYLWLASIVVSFVRFGNDISSKNPYEALCELAMPWYNLAHLISFSKIRTALSNVKTVPMAKVGFLIATADQLREAKNHRRDLYSQNNVKVLSPLVRKHLREQSKQRYTWLAVVSVLILIAHIAVNFQTIRGLISGGHLASSILTSTASTTQQLFDSATTIYNFAGVDGMALPSSPFLLVYALISILTFGHAAQTSALIFIIGAPAAAMSMWALAGIFTRSNASRNVVALAWVVFGYATGIFTQAHLAMILVMVFLPAAFAFAAKAIGVYQTEEPIQSEPSVQAGAWAALCFALVAACEPQIFVATFISGILITVIYHKHIMMMVSMALPSIAVLAPSLVSVIKNPDLFGQIFTDSFRNLGSAASGVEGSPLKRIVDTVSVDAAQNNGAVYTVIFVLGTVCLVILGIFTIVPLAVPSLLRQSRALWCVLLVGFVVSSGVVGVPVALGQDEPIYASSLPSISVIMLAVLVAVTMMSGPATSHFVPLTQRDKEQLEALHPEDSANRSTGTVQRVSFAVSRAIALAATVLLIGAWVCTSALTWNAKSHVVSSDASLPMVVQDYLKGGENRRVAVVTVDSADSISYTIARSNHGDIIDSSAARNVYRFARQERTAKEAKVASALAKLAQNNDNDAIAQLSDAGLGGIYVVYTGETDAYSQFIAHAAASNNAEALVNTNQGTYIRIAVKAASEQGISIRGYDQARHIINRYVWVVSLVLIAVIYLALALPSIFKRGEE